MFYMSLIVSVIFFFKQKTAYEMRISDWSSDVCSSDLDELRPALREDAEVHPGQRSTGIAIAADQPAPRGGFQRDVPCRNADAVERDGNTVAVGDFTDVRGDGMLLVADAMVVDGIARGLRLRLGAEECGLECWRGGECEGGDMSE